MRNSGLRQRPNWQNLCLAEAFSAENNVFEIFAKELEGTCLSIRAKPQEFAKIYVDVVLSEETQNAIYNPQSYNKHGIVPDYAIDNRILGRTLYIEVKRQDGWVEGKPRSAGRGNAHERGCKYFTPGLLEILRQQGNLGQDALPFWTIFQGDITRDPCRVREITCWYGRYDAHFFMWRDISDTISLIQHFNQRLKSLLIS